MVSFSGLLFVFLKRSAVSLAEEPRNAGQAAGSLTNRLVTEGQAFHDFWNHGFMDFAILTEAALALRTFARSEVAQTRLTAHNFASSGDFKPFRGSFFRLATCDGARHGARRLALEDYCAT
jgi:hypothetical protein